MNPSTSDSIRPASPKLPYSPVGHLAPWAPRFLGVFALAQIAVMVAACLPVWAGAISSDTLNAFIPLLAWSPTILLLLAHLVFQRPVPFVRWAALGVRPAGRTFTVIGLLAAVMVFVPTLTIAAAALLGLVDVVPSEDAGAVALMLAPMIVMAMVATLGEEIAWRGYLQSTLSPLGFWRSTLVIGAYWSLAHLPLTMSYWIDGQMPGREVVFTSVNLLLIAVVLSAVRYLSGSVWPAVVGHTLVNTVLVFAYSNLISSTTQLSTGAYWGYALLSWAVWGLAIWFLVRRVAHRSS